MRVPDCSRVDISTRLVGPVVGVAGRLGETFVCTSWPPNMKIASTKLHARQRARLPCAVVTVQAADIAPVTAHWTKLGAHFSALVYYMDEPDGFHVVVTTQQGARDKAAVERFETVLAAGQSAAVSIPRASGEAPARIVLSNAGRHLHIAQPPAPVAA